MEEKKSTTRKSTAKKSTAGRSTAKKSTAKRSTAGRSTKKRSSKNNKKFNLVLGILFLLLVIAGALYIYNHNKNSSKSAITAPFEAHFIDIGQGNATAIMSDGQVLLMDGGDREHSSKLVSYLRDCGVTKLDYVVVSHFDSDHLSGVVGAINAFDVGTVLTPDMTADTKIYESFKTALKRKKITPVHPSQGDKYTIGQASFTVVGPVNYKYEGDNNNSVCIRIVNGNNSFLITGDAEKQSETDMCESGITLRSDVYLAGHHGSVNASSAKLLKTANPSVAVISCGKDNKYGHPNQETLERMADIGAKVYRTDELGTIIAASNGNEITWKSEKGELSDGTVKTKGTSAEPAAAETEPKQSDANRAAPAAGQTTYEINTSTKKVHYPNCEYAEEKNKNIQEYTGTLQELLDQGYTACHVCNPQ